MNEFKNGVLYPGRTLPPPAADGVSPQSILGAFPTKFFSGDSYDRAVKSNIGTGLAGARYVSIGIIAWNEEEAIGPMLQSLFQQSLFAELSQRGLVAEIVCLTNGCTDRTPEVARDIFIAQEQSHPFADAISCRVLDLAQRGKINAWNLFVHWVSAPEARFLILLDSDILIHRPDTLLNLLLTLEHHPEASIAVDEPCKDLEFLPHRSLRQQLSLAASRMTRSASAQLCADSSIAFGPGSRGTSICPGISLPVKTALSRRWSAPIFSRTPVWPMRIQRRPQAAHTFDAYTSLASVFKNQKRQMIGQTMVHILVDDYLKNLPPLDRSKLAETLQERNG